MNYRELAEHIKESCKIEYTDVEIFSLIPSKQGSKSAEFAVAAVNSNRALREIIKVQQAVLEEIKNYGGVVSRDRSTLALERCNEILEGV